MGERGACEGTLSLHDYSAHVSLGRSVPAASAYLTSKLRIWSRLYAQVPGGTLSPASIPKFASPLFIPPAMPRAAVDATTDYYTIGVRQFAQQILPAPLDRTTVWGYGSLTDPSHLSLPVARRSKPGPRGWRA